MTEQIHLSIRLFVHPTQLLLRVILLLVEKIMK